MTAMRHLRVLSPVVFLATVLATSACFSKPVDLTKALQVTEVSSGYFDAGIVEGNKNKIVPTISFRLKNVSNESISSVPVIAKFNVIDDPEELGSAPYVNAIGPEGLPPGQTCKAVVMKTNLGYTSEAPRASMFTHSAFKDVQVEIFGKHGAQNYQMLGRFKIDRQLLTR
jgi:hypothetical protein